MKTLILAAFLAGCAGSKSYRVDYTAPAISPAPTVLTAAEYQHEVIAARNTAKVVAPDTSECESQPSAREVALCRAHLRREAGCSANWADRHAIYQGDGCAHTQNEAK